MIETHCHLDYLKAASIEQIIENGREVGITKILTISVEASNLQKVMELTERFEMVYGSQGIHPHHTQDSEDEHFDEIKNNLLMNKKIVAVGEIGLDYYYLHSPKSIQQQLFSRQLELACELDYPVVIHTRDADDDCEQILKSILSGLKRRGVLHSFTSGLSLAEFAINEGFFLGFNGIITFKNADEVRKIVERCPLEQILLETDAPFLSPIPHRGKENSPAYLPFVAKKIAEIKKLDVDMVIEQTTANALKLFWPESSS
jgi:TatD DNase family protein